MAAAAISLGGDLIGVVTDLLDNPKHDAENAQASWQEKAQFAGCIGMYLALSGDSTGAMAQVAAMADYAQSGKFGLEAPLPGWGGYWRQDDTGYDVPNPWPAVTDQSALAAARAALTGQFSFQQVATMVSQAAGGTPPASITAATESYLSSSGAGLAAAGGTTPGFSLGGNWLIYAAIGLVLLLLIVRHK
ncbi:MAG: hypothetical protein ACRD2F_13425 [Terriglobales bacterium]